MGNEESECLENLLNQSLLNNFRSLPNGEKRYGEKANIGWVKFSKIYLDNNRYCAAIIFSPKGRAKNKLTYTEANIGIVDLKNQTYVMDPSCERMPCVDKDIDKVMQRIGLKRIIEPKKYS